MEGFTGSGSFLALANIFVRTSIFGDSHAPIPLAPRLRELNDRQFWM